MEKADFKGYRALVMEVQQLREQLATLETSMYSPRTSRPSLTPKAHGGSHGPEDAIARHIKLVEWYREKLATKEAQQLAIEQAIESLEDPFERVVMRYRYIEGRNWTYIIARLAERGYSDRQTYRLHGFALLRLKDL